MGQNLPIIDRPGIRLLGCGFGMGATASASWRASRPQFCGECNGKGKAPERLRLPRLPALGLKQTKSR